MSERVGGEIMFPPHLCSQGGGRIPGGIVQLEEICFTVAALVGPVAERAVGRAVVAEANEKRRGLHNDAVLAW